MKNDNNIVNEKLMLLKDGAYYPERFPVSVYRLQFSSLFTFRDASRLIYYLNDLGITDCYASPYFKARRGSQHGYDVSDQNCLNPEVGSDKDFRSFAAQLQKFNMGQIVDFVPNHMSIFDNSKWQDVLENGPSSVYARFFDIDWEPVKAELHQKVLLPILEDLYGIVLERGQISLGREKGTFFFEYRDHRLPVEPKTVVSLLESSLNSLRENVAVSQPDLLELQSIITASKNLPERSDIEPERMTERHREKEIIKKRLGELCRNNEKIRSALNKTVHTINGLVGDSQSFVKLHELLEKQAYRLSYWRVAGDEINYRRFFDINELVALRMEDPAVFEETHRFVRNLFGQRLITGIRIDHVDGLFNPVDYLTHLQKACWLELAANKLKQGAQLLSMNPETIEQSLSEKLDRGSNTKSRAAFRPVYIVVEKILGENESLSRDWPVEGTTGYEFLAALNQVFVDKKQRRRLLDIYHWFTGSNSSFDDIVYDCKNLVLRTTMAGEVNMLAHRLNTVSESSWQYRDFTLNSLRDAIREIIACFPVYRTYINAYAEAFSDNDRAVIDSAITDAKRRNPAVSSAVFDFVRDTLLLQYPTGMDEAGRRVQRLFVMRFQQFTGPVMAKGIEDTAFYIYNPLLSLNEVGGNPRYFGKSISEFHKQNMLRQRKCPYSFIASSTHDSKRSEDVRARINVLSEIPREWKSSLLRWSRFNKGKKLKVHNEPTPDRNEEYLIYQTLIGTYPLHSMTGKELKEYCSRVQNYMLKALKEAKVHSSWINPNILYEKGVLHFVEAILNPSPDNPFLTDFKSLNQEVGVCGIYNSLSQVVLKVFSPGVPDIYQGNELWTFNLTDPDNRAPVDYIKRTRLLNQLKERASNSQGLKGLVKDLIENSIDGRIKLYITWKSLNYRRDNRDLFDGAYFPLEARGPKKDHLCLFAWKKAEKTVLVLVPRFPASLTNLGRVRPLGEQVWKETSLMLPGKLSYSGYRNIFTGERMRTEEGNVPSLSLSEVFKSLPVAVLETR